MACFEQALALFGTMSVPLDEARALSLLGDAHAALGNTAEAHEALARALAVTQKIDTVVAQRMRARLAERMHAGEPAP
ncbi:tetratricopeptide repeat protein [Streptosporangium lutulentum]